MLDNPQNASRIKTDESSGQPSNFYLRPRECKVLTRRFYSIPCRDCNKRYVGETNTKRSLEIRKNEHEAYVKNKCLVKSVLT